jgi:two-component system chemotaxis sensor kinase CheA
MDDELFNEFLNESREHLGNIEADLLTIEEGGANIDEEIVNKVFRAAHSIKGGSSFFGLTKVKELAHKAETVLDMLRSRKMVPNPEVVNVLLAAFDQLRGMINNPAEIETADIGELVVSLTGLASSYLPPAEKATLTQTVSLPAGGGPPITLPRVDVDRAKRCGQCIYGIDYDLIHDIDRRGLNILQVFRELSESGEILDCLLDFASMGTLDGPVGNQLPLRLIFATTLASEVVPDLLLVPKERIQLLFDPFDTNHTPCVAPAPLPPAPVQPPIEVESLRAAPQAQLPEPVPAPAVLPPETPAAVASTTLIPASAAPQPAAANAHASGDETLRVSVGLLETLMNLAGELVLSRNQLHVAVTQRDAQSLGVADQRLNQVTSELQDAIMRTRLQPIGNVLSKFPRVVRDMSNTLGKEIQLDIRGKDVALDRSLIEGLSDPLTHMVRNAVDHGIELPEARARAGKKKMGTIRIEARHEAGQVVVEIADDGKGIDPARVAQAALTKGLITAEKLRSMSNQEKIALIFLPGLSTAEKVTDMSGRGVGMDVVKTNLERLGGKVEIKSEVGKGSLFRIKLPLTLAIIASLIVSVGKERFAIPQINVEELLRIRSEEAKQRIEFVGGAKVLLLRDQIIPLLHLDTLLGVPPAPATPATVANGNGHSAGAPLDVVVVTTGAMQYALVVSLFHETEEIVVKPLGRHLKGLREYAGATVLGDGTVALILDVTGVAAKAQLAAVTKSGHTQDDAAQTESTGLEETQSLLLFHNAPDEICATPLSAVSRIERVTPDRVETAGNRRTMQYRGASLPLVTLADAAAVKPLGDTQHLAVIVANVRGHEVGLLGAMPVDVVEATTAIDQVTHRQPGIAGSAIIRDHTTLITDICELVDAVFPEWKTARTSPSPDGANDGNPVILLAEDSEFFRAQTKKYLEQDGFTVLEAPDGEAAWELLLEHVKDVRAIVTDIEMPRLTGLELARRVRGDGRVAQLPIIALSSLASEDDIATGKAAGVSEYLVKLDREQLIATLHGLAGEPQLCAATQTA